MTGSTYPAWQAAIRKAQAAVAEANAKAAQEEEARQRQAAAEQDAQNGLHLQQVLGLLGIDIPLPECGNVTLDGVKLELLSYRRFPSAAHKFGEPPPAKDNVEFRLCVERELPEADVADFGDDLDWRDLYQHVSGVGKLEGSSWLSTQAELASAVDAVTAGYERQSQRLDALKADYERRCEQRQVQSTPPREPTAEEALLDALKAFIRASRDDLDFDRILDEVCEP